MVDRRGRIHQIPVGLMLLAYLEGKYEKEPDFSMTAIGMARNLNLAIPTVYRHLAYLVKKGMVKRSETVSGKKYETSLYNHKLRAYQITPAGLDEVGKFRMMFNVKAWWKVE